MAEGKTLVGAASLDTGQQARSRIDTHRLSTGFWQFFRMCCVSAVVNGLGFVAYLGLTNGGFDPKLAATICFAAGVTVGFILNRKWTFRDSRQMHKTLLRYIIVYIGAYAGNMLGLYVFFDRLGYPHQFVQAGIIVLLIVLLFAAQRFWIFASTPELPGGISQGS
jgi:putative flippase GtrA